MQSQQTLKAKPKNMFNFNNLKTDLYIKLLRQGFYSRRNKATEIELEQVIRLFQPMAIPIDLIRVGSRNDGGYLIPNDLKGIKACFSAGVANNSDFEYQLAEQDIICFLADASVDNPCTQHNNFNFTKNYIKAIGSQGSITLDDWINKAIASTPLPLSDYILSMDIEGDELEVLLTTPNRVISKFRIITLELHGLERMLHRSFLELYHALICKLSESFIVCHIHPNNSCPIVKAGEIIIPGTIEITLLNRNRILTATNSRPAVLPHALDSPNNPQKNDIFFSDHWTRK